MSSDDLFINSHAVSHFSSESTGHDSSAILAFHSSLPHYAPTPLIFLSALSKSLECNIYLKDESSRLGLPSFKILGASWGAFRALCEHTGLSALTTSLSELKAHLSAHNPAICLVAATDGNHGRAVAYFSRLIGAKCTIYVPQTLPASTVALIQAEGPEVIRSSGNYDDAVREAAAAAKSSDSHILVQDTAWEGYETVPAWIVEGYGTMLAEIDDQLASAGVSSGKPDVLITPVGVGSLASAVVLSGKSHGSIVVAVEPATAACLMTSLRQNKPMSVDTPGTIMSGMDCGTVSSLAFPLLQRGVDACVTLSDHEAHEAVEELRKYGATAGPCGAATLVGVKKIIESESLKERVRGKNVVVLCTEGEREYDVPEA